MGVLSAVSLLGAFVCAVHLFVLWLVLVACHAQYLVVLYVGLRHTQCCCVARTVFGRFFFCIFAVFEVPWKKF